MNEIEYLRDKYKNRDIIEITAKTQSKVIEWLSGGDAIGQVDVREVTKKLCQHGFIKFLNKGVVFIKHESAFRNISVYPFEFTDNGTLLQSIYITNPITEKQELQLLCKVEVGNDTMYQIVEGTYNEELANIHIGEEWQAEKLHFSQLTKIIQQVNSDQPELKPTTKEWYKAVGEEYFRTIIKAQILSIIGLNAYLTLLEKNLFISKIEQKREYKASNGITPKRSKATPFYRYLVQIPTNYTPRKFDLNYLLSEWERCGYMTTKWVLPENADLIVTRRGGRTTNKVKGKYVGILIPINPQTIHRRIKKVPDQPGVKTYE